MRVVVRRERPHPGAQLSLFEERDGWRYQAFVTNTATGQLAFLEARHRAHARVEDRIRHAKDSGLGRFPSREFTINQTWLMLTAIAADLTAWTRLLGCTGDATVLAACEPKALRYRFLHVPARLTERPPVTRRTRRTAARQRQPAKRRTPNQPSRRPRPSRRQRARPASLMNDRGLARSLAGVLRARPVRQF